MNHAYLLRRELAPWLPVDEACAACPAVGLLASAASNGAFIREVNIIVDRTLDACIRICMILLARISPPLRAPVLLSIYVCRNALELLFNGLGLTPRTRAGGLVADPGDACNIEGSVMNNRVTFLEVARSPCHACKVAWELLQLTAWSGWAAAYRALCTGMCVSPTGVSCCKALGDDGIYAYWFLRRVDDYGQLLAGNGELEVHACSEEDKGRVMALSLGYWGLKGTLLPEAVLQLPGLEVLELCGNPGGPEDNLRIKHESAQHHVCGGTCALGFDVCTAPCVCIGGVGRGGVT